MLKRSTVALLTVFALVGFVAVASANVTNVKAGGKSVCEDAAWIVYNLSETQDTKIEFDIGPHAYAWKKVFKYTLPPGGFEANAIALKSVITNKGPGTIQVNCQRKRYDAHDWKVDAGSSKSYQPDYHLDHVRPGTYIEPGLGQPQGTEGRQLFDISRNKPEWQR